MLCTRGAGQKPPATAAVARSRRMLKRVWSRDQASFVKSLFSRMSYDAMRPRTLPSLAGNAGYWEHRTRAAGEQHPPLGPDGQNCNAFTIALNYSFLYYYIYLTFHRFVLKNNNLYMFLLMEKNHLSNYYYHQNF